jgi:hypothetical protein
MPTALCSRRMDGMLKWAARAHVIDELMAEAINVALPVGACDIDILAFLESRTEPCGLVSVPIQIVVSRGDALSRNLQAARVLGMLVALVWDIGESAPMRSFALTSAELTLVKMIDLMDGARAARAFAGAGSAPAQRENVLRNAMKPFAMSRGQWRKKLLGIVGGRPETEPCCRHH